MSPPVRECAIALAQKVMINSGARFCKRFLLCRSQDVIRLSPQ
jgi:hypothetical protein